MLLLLKNYVSLHLVPPLCWYLSLTSLHLSFHLLLFLVSQDPQSLLRARKLQLKLSQSGTQLRLSGDLRGEKARDWL